MKNIKTLKELNERNLDTPYKAPGMPSSCMDLNGEWIELTPWNIQIKN